MNKNEHYATIKSDLFRYAGTSNIKTFVRQMMVSPGFKYTYALRKCQYYTKKNNPNYYFYRYLLRKYKYKFGYEIPDGVKVGKGFFINHLGGILINPEAVIGDNVNITKGLTIGQTNRGKNKGVPTIGNSVWIGANATIVGKITIGDNVLIAPNSYVHSDVPSNSIVTGNPAEIIANEKATEGYINRTV